MCSALWLLDIKLLIVSLCYVCYLLSNFLVFLVVLI